MGSRGSVACAWVISMLGGGCGAGEGPLVQPEPTEGTSGTPGTSTSTGAAGTSTGPATLETTGSTTGSEDPDSTSGGMPSSSTGGTRGTGDTTPGTSETDTSETDTSETSTSETGTSDTEPGPVPADGCAFSESFDGLADGSDWPAPWIATGGVLFADVQGGRGRVVPFLNGYSLGRMFVPLRCVDGEGTFTFEFSDGETQGVGLYLRQNGGYLEETEPLGGGYVAFSQLFADVPGITVLREVDGYEEFLAPYSAVTLLPGVVYAVRFRVTQLGADTTRLRARVWPAAELEPVVWQVDLIDDYPDLQEVAGGMSIDTWSSLGDGVPSDLFVDDIVITAAPVE